MAEVDFKIDCRYGSGCTLKTERCQKTCPLYLEMNYMIVNCGMPDATPYIKTLIPTTDTEFKSYERLQNIKDNIVDYVTAGHDIFIVSNYSFTGKTSWAIKLMYRYFDRIWSGNGFKVRGYFLYVPDFVTKLKAFSYKETAEYKEIMHNLEHCDLVIWDAITDVTLNEHEQGLLSSVLGKRFMKGKANIYTGNAKVDLEVLGRNLADKISMAERILLDGQSRTKGMNS